MNKSTEILLGGPMFANLTGSRRAAYIRQWIIGACILVASVVVLLLSPLFGWEMGRVMTFAVTLLGLQVVYATLRRETIWQLRAREIRHRSDQSKNNEIELLAFAAKLQKKTGHDGQ